MNITLKKESTEAALTDPGSRGSWPLRVSAFYDAEMTQPAPIFVYHRAGAGHALEGDAFDCIADVMHMEELPTDAPTSDTPYFRLPVMDVICRSAAHQLEFWDDIQIAVQNLIDETQAADVMDLVETVTLTPR